MPETLTISPVLNQKLELLAAKTEVEYLVEAIRDKHSASYAAALKALEHINNALSLNKA